MVIRMTCEDLIRRKWKKYSLQSVNFMVLMN